MTVSNMKKWSVNLYMIFLFVVYVFLCPHGYDDYDLYKRMILLSGAILFLIIFVIICIFSLKKGENIPQEYNLIEYIGPVVLFCFFLPVLTSIDKFTFFFGDAYRYIGFLFWMISIGGCLIVYSFGKWTLFFENVLAISALFTFLIQILQSIGIDPCNWLNNFSYDLLLGTLGNLDQNAYYDGILVSVLMAFFVYAKKQVRNIAYGILLVIGFMAGMITRSDSFFAALGIACIVFLGTAICNPQIRMKTVGVFVLFLVAILLQRFLQSAWIFPASKIVLFLMNWRFIMVYGLAILILLIVSKLQLWQSDKASRNLMMLYIIGLILAVVIIAFLIKNQYGVFGSVAADLSVREKIWQAAIRMMEEQSLTCKILGIGFGHFSMFSMSYVYFYDQKIVADAHNIFLDIYVSCGMLGLFSYVAFFVCTIVQLRTKVMEKLPKTIGFLIVAAYIGGGLLNGNLIIATPIAFFMIGYALSSQKDGLQQRDV